MISNEEYICFLKSIISCISHGDYSSAKELSHLELEKMTRQEKKNKKEISRAKRNIKVSQSKDKCLERYNSKELGKIIEVYSEYILNIIERTDSIKEVQKKAISIEEFIEKM